MGDISVVDSMELSGEYPFEIRTQTIGEVSTKVIDESVETVKSVFIKMGYMESPPEFISISEDEVLLPSGKAIAACYGYDGKKVPGRIYLSSKLSKTSFGESNIPIEIATAAFAAHEAVEHVNHMRGKDLLSSNDIVDPKIHAMSDTEQEANEIACEVIEKRYGWTVNLGNELPDKK